MFESDNALFNDYGQLYNTRQFFKYDFDAIFENLQKRFKSTQRYDKLMIINVAIRLSVITVEREIINILSQQK